MPSLYIAIYRPRYGNYLHWALYLDNDDEKPIIFDVSGEHGTFTRAKENGRPEDNNRLHKRDIKVGTINKGEDVRELERIMDTVVEIDNETIHWNCQDYVIEALEILRTECIIDEEDEDYEEGVRIAKDEYFGQRG